MIVLALIGAMQAADPPLPTQYDLTCEGRLFSTSKHKGASLGPAAMKTTVQLHVDLGHNKWCEGSCQTGPLFLQANAYKLTLIDGHDDEGSEYYVVDRQTGALFQEIVQPSYKITVTATCKPGPFSGFPEPRPKF